MASFNKITIVGYCGRDPELRFTAQGTPVADFSMATNEKYKDEETVTWFKVVMWGKLAELASQYLVKGSHVYIEGRLSQKEWTAKDGEVKQTLEVTATDMKFLSSKGDGEQKPKAQAAAAKPRTDPGAYVPEPVTEDDVPFAWIVGFLTVGWLALQHGQSFLQRWV